MVCRLPWNVLNFWLEIFRVVSYWYCLRPGAFHGLRAATMERSGFSKFLKQFEARRVPWFASGYYRTFLISQVFEAVWGQASPMVCGRLPWNVQDFWLEIFQGGFLFGVVWGQVCPMVCGRLPWNVLDLTSFWSSLRPGASHGLRAATMGHSGFSKFLKQTEVRLVQWFTSSYHEMFLI